MDDLLIDLAPVWQMIGLVVYGFVQGDAVQSANA